MKLNVQISKDQLLTVGRYGARLGKTIIYNGCKYTIISSAKTIAETVFEEGFDSVKGLGWNDFLSDKEARVHKRIKKKEKISYLKAEIMKMKMAKKAEKNLNDEESEES